MTIFNLNSKRGFGIAGWEQLMIKSSDYLKFSIFSLWFWVASACAVGPGPGAPDPAGGMVGTRISLDTLRGFYDSLAVRQQGVPAAGVNLLADSATTLSWLTIFADPVLTELVRTALIENKDMAIARARLREFRAQVGVARADLLPQLTGNASAATQQIVFGAFGNSRFEAYRITADLTWELDFWGKLRRGLEAANRDLDARDADLKATILTLVGDVGRVYLELREAEANRAIAERTLASRRETLRIAQERFAQGVSSELDVRQFEAQLAAPAATMAELSRVVAQKEHELSLLLGSRPVEIPRGRAMEDVIRTVVVPDSIPANLIERRPDVSRAIAERNAARSRIGVALGNRLPRFFVTGQYGRQGDELSNVFRSEKEIFTAQAGVSIPLFTGLRLENQEQAARARAEQAEAQHERVVLVALREVSDALVALRTLADQVTAQQLQVGALTRALELSNQRYLVGVADWLEVLESQRSLFNAEISLTQTRRAWLAATIQLYKALGGSWTPAP